MRVLSRKELAELLEKVMGTALVDLEEARAVLTASVESQIKLLWDLEPPLRHKYHQGGVLEKHC